MKVEKQDLSDGTCNFCTPLYYKEGRVCGYDSVYLIERGNGGVAVRICPLCVDDLIRNVAKLSE